MFFEEKDLSILLIIILIVMFALSGFVIVNARAEEYNPYVNLYVEVEEGEPDYHNPWVPDYNYGDIHHRAGANCPESYYELLKIWQHYGTMYEQKLINYNQLVEMDYCIFAMEKGCNDYDGMMKFCQDYAKKLGIEE